MSAATTVAAWIPPLEKEIRDYLASESSGHDPYHAFRVRDLAVDIAKTLGADIEVVSAAALLHDIGHVRGRKHHSRRGADLARDILFRSAFPPNKISQVVACIEDHEWLPGRADDPATPSLEYQAFADADRLDALGAIGIARVFAFGGAHQRPMWNPEPNAPGGEYGISSVHHFYDKLFRLPTDMYTALGRALADQRVVILKDFLEAFYREWEGKDLQAVAKTHSVTSLRTFPKRSVNIRDRIRRVIAMIFQPDPIN